MNVYIVTLGRDGEHTTIVGVYESWESAKCAHPAPPSNPWQAEPVGNVLYRERDEPFGMCWRIELHPVESGRRPCWPPSTS
jgi:hypothetical protein